VTAYWRNVLADRGLCFVEDMPGAGDRYHDFTPQPCTPGAASYGEAMGANWGDFLLRDLDADGTPEVIVQSAWLHPMLTDASCQPRTRSVYKIRFAGAKPAFERVENVALPGACADE
jgi:hypothetical protein